MSSLSKGQRQVARPFLLILSHSSHGPFFKKVAVRTALSLTISLRLFKFYSKKFALFTSFLFVFFTLFCCFGFGALFVFSFFVYRSSSGTSAEKAALLLRMRAMMTFFVAGFWGSSSQHQSLLSASAGFMLRKPMR